jgi:malate dehydrogenase
MTKLTIVGAGHIGGQAAFWAIVRGFKEIVLYDIIEGLPQGKALDLAQSTPLLDSTSKVTGTTDWKDTAKSDVVIITAGKPRTPNIPSREALLQINEKIMRSVITGVMKHSKNPFLIIVSNPLDTMTYLALKLSGLPKNKVMGMGSLLDSSRFKTFLAQEANVKVNEVQGMVIGGHTPLMIPVSSQATIQGKQVRELLSPEQLRKIEEQTRIGGPAIVDLLKTGSAFYTPGVALVEMASAIVQDTKTVIPCSTFLKGEYDMQDICLGVPCVLGKKGVEEIKQLNLSPEEQEQFKKSGEEVRKTNAFLSI